MDAIKTRGESVAIALALVGARPVKEATGRVVKYELVPLPELGRPRVDVLASLSGIFRDSFANVVDLLDDLFETAANAEVGAGVVPCARISRVRYGTSRRVGLSVCIWYRVERVCAPNFPLASSVVM